MLVQFTVQNYKCFKEEVKFSMIASNYDKDTRIEDNTFFIEKFNLRLLKSAVLYGANASGKTKFIAAMGFFRHFTVNSSDGQAGDEINIDSFRLSTTTKNTPTVFEIIFILDNELYRYGYEVDKYKVHAEWLYHRPKTKEIELFYREGQEFSLHKTRFKVKDLVDRKRIRENTLLLSIAAQFNDPVAQSVLYYMNNMSVLSGIHDHGYGDFTIDRMMDNEQNKKQTIEFLKKADLGIDSIEIEKMDMEGLPDELLAQVDNANFYESSALHKVYDEQESVSDKIKFSMNADESQGTKKYFALSGLILETLQEGDILFVDELANKFHPNLTCHLIELFNSKKTNPNNAQLVFNTHDTNLLSSGLFRRDQIWFVEKDRYGAADMYALSDFKKGKARKDDNFEKNYIQGKYGAIPYLGDFDKLFEDTKS